MKKITTILVFLIAFTNASFSAGDSSSSELIDALNILNMEDPYLNVRYDKTNNRQI